MPMRLDITSQLVIEEPEQVGPGDKAAAPTSEEAPESRGGCASATRHPGEQLRKISIWKSQISRESERRNLTSQRMPRHEVRRGGLPYVRGAPVVELFELEWGSLEFRS